jgi:hypothetical protein
MAYRKKVWHSRYSLCMSARDCWLAHPERSFATCKRLCKEFKNTFATLGGDTPSPPWAIPSRRRRRDPHSTVAVIAVVAPTTAPVATSATGGVSPVGRG